MGILSKGRAIIGKTGVSFGGMYLLGAGVKIPNKKWFQTMGWAGKENTRKLQILYLNCTIVTTYFVINLIMNWDSLLYKSQFQFVNSAELYYTKKGFAAVFHITNNFLMPTVYIGYDSFALTLTLVSSFLFSVALLSN